ncbi:hypothetical protein M885DRAFT_617148, partial [Pelagophyceae sp. CCMP2097]
GKRAQRRCEQPRQRRGDEQGELCSLRQYRRLHPRRPIRRQEGLLVPRALLLRGARRNAVHPAHAARTSDGPAPDGPASDNPPADGPARLGVDGPAVAPRHSADGRPERRRAVDGGPEPRGADDSGSVDGRSERGVSDDGSGDVAPSHDPAQRAATLRPQPSPAPGRREKNSGVRITRAPGILSLAQITPSR